MDDEIDYEQLNAWLNTPFDQWLQENPVNDACEGDMAAGSGCRLVRETFRHPARTQTFIAGKASIDTSETFVDEHRFELKPSWSPLPCSQLGSSNDYAARSLLLDDNSSGMVPGAEGLPSGKHLESYLSDLHSGPSHVYSASQRPSQAISGTSENPFSNVQLDPNHEFHFTSGAVLIEDRSRKSPKNKTTPDPNGLKCDSPGCRYKGTFKRKYELKRHKNIHEKNRTYYCPVIDCERQKRPFHRGDKFRLHVKDSHTDEDEGLCSEAQCRTGPLTMDLMRVHGLVVPNEHRNSILRQLAGLNKLRQCLVNGCRKWIQYDKVQEHLRKHPFDERIRAEAAIQQMGYDAWTLRVICPVCKTPCQSQSDFEEHCTLAHLVSDGNHFAHFREHSRKNSWNYTFHPWDAWTDYKLLVFSCPHCHWHYESLLPWEVTKIDHHLSLLVDSQSIHPYRRAILRLWPDFGTHPVFNDVRKLSGSSNENDA